MATMVGSGFHLNAALGVGGTAAEGTVLTASNLGQFIDIQTDGAIQPNNGSMDVGDSFVVDTDRDGDFSDEAATTQVDNDRYVNSTFTYADGSTSTGTLELITLSDGSQAILVNEDAAAGINAASDQIQSITLGRFTTTFDNYYNQRQYMNEITNSVVCFCEKTLVKTPTGERQISSLVAGDDVVTVRDGVQKIVWIGRRKLSTAELVASPHLRPIRISAGALGEGVPHSDLLVSPQHRILVVSKIAERMFGQREIFVPAIKLVEAEGIEQVASFAPVTYVHMLFETHQIVFANGAPAESLYTGRSGAEGAARNGAQGDFRDFPELETAGQGASPAHLTIRKQAQVSKLLARHKRNHKQLVLLES